MSGAPTRAGKSSRVIGEREPMLTPLVPERDGIDPDAYMRWRADVIDREMGIDVSKGAGK